MAQLTVRKLDPALVRRLKVRAAQNERSAEAEHRAILERALLPEQGDSFWERAARLRTAIKRRRRGRPLPDSTAIVRAERDRRGDLRGNE